MKIAIYQISIKTYSYEKFDVNILHSAYYH
jgi:hypothetical protein